MLIHSTIILGKASLSLSAQRKLIVWRTTWKENNMLYWQNQCPLLSTCVDLTKIFSLLFPRGMLFISVFLQAGTHAEFCSRIYKCVVLNLFQVLLSFRVFHWAPCSRPFLVPFSWRALPMQSSRGTGGTGPAPLLVFVWQLPAACWAGQRQRHLPLLIWIKGQKSLFHHQITLKRKKYKLWRNYSDVTLFQ